MALLTTRYDAWLAAVLETGASLPSESKATCSNCAMCSDGAGTSPNGSSSESFSTDVKCCTYWPTLANFLLGGILRSSEPDEGRARVEDLLRSRPAMFTPFGAAPPPEYERVYAAVHSSRFGRAPELKCPFHDSAQAASCTIWHHRNAVCASWFCKHDRGERGALFW